LFAKIQTYFNHKKNISKKTVPEFLLATQQKYIEKLEKENAELKALLKK